MPIKIEWLIENRVILSTSYGVVTFEEAIRANDEFISFLQEGYAVTGKKVHILSDAKKVLKQPGALEVRDVFTHLTDPACGDVMVGGLGNPFLLFFAKVVTSVLNTKVSLYNTPEQAITALQSQDPTLPELLPVYRKIRHLPNPDSDDNP